MALFTGAFFVAQVSLIIVAKPFYAIFCTSCVPHKPKTGFTACQIVDNLERLGTLWYAMKQIWRTKKIIKMASNIEIQKKCEWCGTIFTAHKITTAYCSHRCANLAYKDRVRKERIQEFHLKHDAELKPNSRKRVLNPYWSCRIFRCRPYLSLSVYQKCENQSGQIWWENSCTAFGYW